LGWLHFRLGLLLREFELEFTNITYFFLQKQAKTDKTNQNDMLAELRRGESREFCF